MKNALFWPALRISALYALFSGCWILFSDRVLETLIADPAAYSEMQTYKGWFFVLVTAGLLFVYARGEMRRREGEVQRLRRGREEQRRALDDLLSRSRSNLTTGIGLMNLATTYFHDEADRSMGRQCVAGLRAMALTYEELDVLSGAGTLSVAPYLEKVVQEASHAHGANRRGLHVQVDVDNVPLDVDRAMSLGLVVTELVANAVQHAFPKGRKGVVEVASRKEEGALVVSVRDDGVGMPEGVEPETSDTLGMTLVSGYASQAGFRVRLVREEGTRFEISIPLTA